MLDVPVEFHFYASAVVYSCLLCIGVTLFALLDAGETGSGKFDSGNPARGRIRYS